MNSSPGLRSGADLMASSPRLGSNEHALGSSLRALHHLRQIPVADAVLAGPTNVPRAISTGKRRRLNVIPSSPQPSERKDLARASTTKAQSLHTLLKRSRSCFLV